MRHKIFLYLSLASAMGTLSVMKFFDCYIPWLANVCWGWMLFIAIANLIIEAYIISKREKKKKRRCKKCNDTLQHQVERTINFAEMQIK
jgi:hypothetical protein